MGARYRGLASTNAGDDDGLRRLFPFTRATRPLMDTLEFMDGKSFFSGASS